MEALNPALVAQARNGHLPAFDELFQRTHRRLYNFIHEMVSNAEDAADLAQETYIRAWRGLENLRSDEAFLVWLHRIALNIVRDFRRRTPPPVLSLDDPDEEDDPSASMEIPDWSQEPEHIALSHAMQTSVREAVRSLPENHRAVVIMHHLEGMEVADIAKVLDVPVGTVLSRLARARETLRRKLSSLVED